MFLLFLFFEFHQATENDQVKIVEYLLELGCRQRTDPYGRTAKDIAVFFGRQEIVTLLEQAE